MFNEHSAGAITVQGSLHKGFLKDLGLAREEAEVIDASPTNLAPTPASCSERLLWAITPRC
jgi:thiaminase (transcriptional activator TenA)